MRSLAHLHQFRVHHPLWVEHEDDHNGMFAIPHGPDEIKVIASDGLGWDHVSASLPNRCPTWDEMCLIKELFFKESETVVQFHPAKKDYVNHHPYCLHLWRDQNQELKTPPSFLVGPRKR